MKVELNHIVLKIRFVYEKNNRIGRIGFAGRIRGYFALLPNKIAN
jgi:hypothetical protein